MAIEAPVHRLQPAIDVATFEQLAERANLRGLGGKTHGLVWVVPVAQHTEAHEIGLLQIDLRLCVRARQRHQFFHRQILAVLLFHIDLDRHAVAVPAGDIDRIESRHLFRLDNHVLENLVDGVSDMDGRVGIRRTVVQDELRPAPGLPANLFVEFSLLPLRNPVGLASGKIAAHGERRIGQVQRTFVINFLVHHLLPQTAKWSVPYACRHASA